jgi:hypothetical protein
MAVVAAVPELKRRPDSAPSSLATPAATASTPGFERREYPGSPAPSYAVER